MQFCTNLNKCHCELGWGGPDCSLQVEVAPPPASTRAPETTQSDLSKIMQKKETPYGRYDVLEERSPRTRPSNGDVVRVPGAELRVERQFWTWLCVHLDDSTYTEHMNGRFRDCVSFAGSNNSDNLETLTMVFILVGVVKGVFICFAVVAVCYRYIQSEVRGVIEYSLRNVLYIGFRNVTLHCPITIVIIITFRMCLLCVYCTYTSTTLTRFVMYLLTS